MQQSQPADESATPDVPLHGPCPESLLRRALEEFVAAIDTTGGIKRDRKGYPVPVIDKEWIDLADAYVTACQALGRKPQWADKDEEDQVGRV